MEQTFETLVQLMYDEQRSLSEALTASVQHFEEKTGFEVESFTTARMKVDGKNILLGVYPKIVLANH